MGAQTQESTATTTQAEKGGRAPRRWLWVVAATCTVAFGAGAAVGLWITSDTPVGRGTGGSALAPTADGPDPMLSHAGRHLAPGGALA